MKNYEVLMNVCDVIMIRELKRRLYGEGGELPEREENEQVTEMECIFCGNKQNLCKYMGKYYCLECYQHLKELR